MKWFFISLIAPFLWSLLNHTDKYLINKFPRQHKGVGALILFSSLFALLVLPVILIIDKSALRESFANIFSLISTGIFFSLAVVFYMYAIEKEDASYVVPFWQLVPVFAYFLGIFFLGEHLETIKMIGSLITIIGAVTLSLEFEEGQKFRLKAVFFMVCSSLLLALSDVIFKDRTAGSSFWSSTFWNQAGIGLFGIFCLIWIKQYRFSFFEMLRKGGKQIMILNIVGESVQAIALIISYYATLLAPIALVLLVSQTSLPVFVFLEGIILTTFFPFILKEKLSKKHFTQKLLSIIMMCIGVYLVL